MHIDLDAPESLHGHGRDAFSGASKMIRVRRANPARQRGVSLFIVMIILLLSLVIALGGLAVARLNESLVGNQSDAQRAYAAAQALLDAAQTDIRLNNGRDCDAAGFGDTGTNSYFAGTNNCTLRYPRGLFHSGSGIKDGYSELLAAIGGGNQCWPTNSTTPNLLGVCISSGPDSSEFLTSRVNNGVTTGTLTGAEQFANGAGYNNTYIQSALNNTSWGGSAIAGSGAIASLALQSSGTANFQGRYWVEVFPYAVNNMALSTAGVGAANVPVPDGTYPFIFRITALAQGLRGNTVSVLRTYYVPYPQ